MRAGISAHNPALQINPGRTCVVPSQVVPFEERQRTALMELGATETAFLAIVD
jgi:hypothetical protein